MALLKDLIVQGASRFIGDAYFATIKAGVWNGTPIDLSHGGTAGETTAGKILTSTTTSGTSAWTAASSITVGTATTATKLSTVSKTAWGLTYWTSGGVPDSISGAMSSVTNIDSLLYFDTTNSRIGIGNDSPVDKLDVDGKVVIYPKGIDNSTLKASLIIKLQNSTEDSGDNWGGAKPSFGILFNRFWTSNNNAYGETACAGIFATVSSSWRGGLLFRTKSNQTLGGTHDTDALRLAPSGAAYFSDVVSARSKVLAELNATTTTAGLVFVSTTTAGRGEWKQASTVTSGNATYAANVGAAGTLHTNYVTAAEVIAVYNWYATMIDTNNDSDTLINRWKEVCDFLNNFTEADTLASILSTYVTLGTAQTITGAKTFSNPISGDLLGNATTADRLKSTTAVGGAGTPVYFTGGLPVACTAANVRTFLGLGTVYSHAHTDYVTNVSFDSANRKLQLSKGGGTATDIVTFGTAYSKNIDNSTAGYCAYYSAASTVSGTSILTFGTNTATFGSSSTNVTITGYGKLTVTKSAELGPIEVYRTDGNYAVGLSCYSGSTKTLNGVLGIGGSASTGVATNKPFWTPDNSTYYQLAYSTAKTAVGGTGTPVYVDANGQIQTCTAYSSASVSYAASSGQVKTVTRSTNAAHYLTFVDSNNSTATAESVYTDAGITYNPSTNLLTVEKLTASGVVNLSGSTTIDSLTAGSLIVTGASSLTGNVSMGTVTAGTWNGSVIDVAHGGTGCSTLTSGSALIGNGTGAVTFRSIDNTTTVGSLVNLTTWAASTNLVTRNVIAHWDGRYQTTSNASNLAYCNKGAFGDAATRTYATTISTASGTTSATVNNYNSDSYVPTNNAVYNFVTSTLGIAATIEKTSITKSLNSSTWTETGYTLYSEEQGSYMLQIVDTTTSAVFTGVFSIYHADSATGNDLDEIPLHMCASATNKVRIYAATLNGKLLVSSQNTSATNHTLKIKYKKII